MKTFCLAALMLAAVVVLPSSASAFGISNFNYTNSTSQAAGHPNVTVSFTRTGSESEDLKDIKLDLPTGVFANPEAPVTKCTTTQFNADTCPNDSHVGSVTANVRALNTLNLSIPGSIDVLTPNPDQAATLGITLRPSRICILFVFCAQPNKIYLKTGITVKTFDNSGLRTYTPGQPSSSVIGIPLLFVTPTITGDITINGLTLNFQSRANASNNGRFFWYQTTSCDVATASVTLVSYQNVEAPASKSYTPTGCSSVPFNPSVSYTPGTLNAGAATTANFSLSIPDADATIQNSLAKIVDIDFANGSGINLGALSGVTPCTEDQLKADTCPASSVLGTASATSRFLPPTSGTGPGLIGKIYAMGVGNQIPVGVRLLGPRSTTIIFRGTLGTRGDASLGTGHVYALFDRIPQVPYGNFSLAFSSNLYKNPDTCGTATHTAKITGFSGAVVTRTMTNSIVNCAPAPNTTITNGPPSTTSNAQPAFTFTSTIAGSTFQCKMDAEAYQLCSSPYTPALPLTNGSHTFSVYAVNGLTPDPTPATYTFTVNRTSSYGISFAGTPGIAVSSSLATAHPNLSTTVNVTGGQPKSISIKLPAGFNASLTAVPNCSAADAAAGNCPATSKVGTMQITANTFSGPVSGVGDVFLTAAPTATDAGGLAVKVPLGGLGNFIAQGGAFLVNNGNNQNLDIRNFPTAVGGTDITVTQLVMNLSGANKFLTNASNCAATDGFVVNSTAFDGSLAAPVTSAYQATCSPAPAFTPALNLNVLNPNAGQTSGVVANVTVPADQSTIKTLRTVLPPSLGPNYAGFGQPTDQCPTGAASSPTAVFDPSACPAQSKVGTMVINTPLLPNPLVGDVYLINKSPLPWFGVKFDQPGISVRVTGVTSLPKVDPLCDEATDPNGYCQTQISVLFNNLPDVPMTGVQLNLNGPARTGVGGPIPGELLAVALPSDPSCVSGSLARSTVTPFATGSPIANLTQAINVTGCP